MLGGHHESHFSEIEIHVSQSTSILPEVSMNVRNSFVSSVKMSVAGTVLICDVIYSIFRQI
jgi:hypothetical protein